MEERKLTDEQVLKALEICGNEEGCRDCPYKINKIECCFSLERASLAIIKRLQDDYLKLKEKYVKVLDLNEKVITEQKSQIEWLENERTYLQMVADAFKGDYKNAKADGVRELLQELIEMEIKLDPLRSGIRYKALIGYAEENGIEVDL